MLVARVLQGEFSPSSAEHPSVVLTCMELVNDHTCPPDTVLSWGSNRSHFQAGRARCKGRRWVQDGDGIGTEVLAFSLSLFSLIFCDLISASYRTRKPQFPGKQAQAPFSSSRYFYVILSFW